jgi:glycosyltransferase involved in cell wall biosynthesis
VRPPLHPDIGVLALVADTWNPYWQPRHHVLGRLARYFHVVWIDPAPGWREAVNPWGERPGRQSLNGLPPGFQLYRPRWLATFYRPRWLSDLTFTERLKRGRRLLTRAGSRRIVLYLWRPMFRRALQCVRHDFSCYHVDDEYAFSDVEVPTTEEEAGLIRSVDHVIVHSRGLLEKKGNLNSRTTLIPNGVDYQAFSRPCEEPEDLRRLPRPRIGYTGVIKQQLDWTLLVSLVDRHPSWSFVFVGPRAPHEEIFATLDALARRPNVYFLGPKPVPELARYPQHFDVCIMPYRLIADANYIYPLKLHEYLASGSPAVGTPIPSLAEFTDVVQLASTVEEWSAALGGALAPGASAPAAREARRAVARQYDWDVLVERIAEIMLAGVSDTRGP